MNHQFHHKTIFKIPFLSFPCSLISNPGYHNRLRYCGGVKFMFSQFSFVWIISYFSCSLQTKMWTFLFVCLFIVSHILVDSISFTSGRLSFPVGILLNVCGFSLQMHLFFVLFVKKPFQKSLSSSLVYFFASLSLSLHSGNITEYSFSLSMSFYVPFHTLVARFILFIFSFF